MRATPPVQHASHTDTRVKAGLVVGFVVATGSGGAGVSVKGQERFSAMTGLVSCRHSGYGFVTMVRETLPLGETLSHLRVDLQLPGMRSSFGKGKRWTRLPPGVVVRLSGAE